MRYSIIPVLLAALLADTSAARAQAVAPDTLTAARVLMHRADELHREHRLDAALELYHDAVTVMNETSELPVLALQRIATIHLAERRPRDAAEAMDRLAARAEWLGYPDVQARALLEAAALHQQTGNRSAAWARVQRLQPLLDSPHLDAETTARIRWRLGAAERPL